MLLQSYVTSVLPLQFFQHLLCTGHEVRKPDFVLHPNSKGADQLAHLVSLISAFVIHSLQSMMSKLASCKISTFQLVSVAELAGLSLTCLQTPRTGFLASRDILYMDRVTTNLSSGFPTKRDSKQSPQLQRLAKILKF